MQKENSFSFGFPHSSYSPVVNGMLSSNIVVSTSTKGTEATIPLNNSGAKLITEPINKPPADPPLAYKCLAEVYFISIKNLKQGFIKFLERSRINTTGIGITASKIVNHAVGFEIESSQKRINGKPPVWGYVIKRSPTFLLDRMGYTP